MANNKQTVSDQVQVSPTREKLKASNAAVMAAQQAVKEAGDLVTRAEAAVAAAHKRVESFGDLDQRCVAWRVQALKSGADSSALPGDLKDQQREKILAGEELQHAESVLASVREDHVKSMTKQAEAEKLRSAAVAAIYKEQIQSIVDQFIEARRVTKHFEVLLKETGLPHILPSEWTTRLSDQRHEQLHQSLLGRDIKFGSIQDWTEISHITARAHNEHVDGRTAERIADAHAKARDYWKSFADRLMDDPYADPSLPPVHPHLLGHTS